MALTADQLISLCTQDAHCPGYTSQAQLFLNMILSDLCRTYDFEVAAKTLYGNFDPGLIAPVGNSVYGSGPYALPADFLRMKDKMSAFWTLLGVVYPMIPCDLSEFDMLVQQAGTQSYPYIIATDMSLADETVEDEPGTPGFYVYSPPSGNYPYTIRYFSQMPDMTDFTQVPWFPHQGYLRRKLSAALMGIVDDERQANWEMQADGMLGEYLKLKDNKSNRAQTVSLDRRRFGRGYSSLPNTKTIGW